MSETTLSIPSSAPASSNAAIQLLAQVYVVPYLSSGFKIVSGDSAQESNSEVSLPSHAHCNATADCYSTMYSSVCFGNPGSSARQLSLTLPSSSPKTDSKDFLSIFKSLLESAGQTLSAFPATAGTADAENWIAQATDLRGAAKEGEAPMDVKALDGHLKTRTYVAGASAISAADVAVYGALAGYMVRRISQRLSVARLHARY